MDIRCGDHITFRVRMAASFQIFILYGIEGGNEPDLGSVITQPDFPSVEILERLPESLRITVCQYWIVCGPFSHHNGIPFRVGGNISGIIQLKNGTGSEGALQENDGIPILNVKAVGDIPLPFCIEFPVIINSGCMGRGGIKTGKPKGSGLRHINLGTDIVIKAASHSSRIQGNIPGLHMDSASAMVPDPAALLSGGVGEDPCTVHIKHGILSQADAAAVLKGFVILNAASHIQRYMTGYGAYPAAVSAEVTFLHPGLIPADFCGTVQSERTIFRVTVDAAPIADTGSIICRQSLVDETEIVVGPAYPYPAAAVIERSISCDLTVIQCRAESAGAGCNTERSAFITRLVSCKAYGIGGYGTNAASVAVINSASAAPGLITGKTAVCKLQLSVSIHSKQQAPAVGRGVVSRYLASFHRECAGRSTVKKSESPALGGGCVILQFTGSKGKQGFLAVGTVLQPQSAAAAR